MHCVKCTNMEFFSGPYFTVFGLNTEIYSVNLLFNLNKGKYGPAKTPDLDTFHVVMHFLCICYHHGDY